MRHQEQVEGAPTVTFVIDTGQAVHELEAPARSEMLSEDDLHKAVAADIKARRRKPKKSPASSSRRKN